MTAFDAQHEVANIASAPVRKIVFDRGVEGVHIYMNAQRIRYDGVILTKWQYSQMVGYREI